MKRAAHTIRSGSVHLLPILHGELELAQVVFEAVQRLRPAAIAVELPRSVQGPYCRAVRRLPRISGLYTRNARGERVYYLIEPADPLVEAVRLALENATPLHFVDLDLDLDYPDWLEAVPDAYAITRIGHRAFVEACLASPLATRFGPEDERREHAMAARLTRLAARTEGPVLFVGGLVHVRRIADRIGQCDAEPIDRAAREVRVFNLHPSSCREVLSVWGYLGAAYERARAAALGRVANPPESAPEGARVINLFERLSGLRKERPRSQAAPSAEPKKPERLPVDRQKVLLRLCREAGRRYETVTGEKLKPYHVRVYLKLLRNWSLRHGRLQPNLYQIVVGARASVDDNFAYELFQLATAWPWQSEEAEIPTERVTLEDLGRGAERIRFRPRQVVRRLRAMASRPRLGKNPDEWLQGFDNPFGYCSFPPEDLALEAFSTYVQKKARGVLSEESKRVEPFTTSLLDGIDMRETIRNWHTGKLYVAELRKGLGGVGSVVVVFDEDRERYPWEITWLGEMEQEGDMALYATHPLQQIVGPGICRAEYGGFLLSYPPGRMSDVWGDEAFQAARTRAERLLMAGVDYCEHKLVAYVARKPPRQEMKAWAGRFGKKIVYIPLGQFSPDTLKKLRVFHVLFGKDKRAIARDYIW